MAEFDCVGDDLALGVCIDKLEAAVGIHCWPNVESILGTKIPRPSGCRFGMDEHPTTNWAQRRLIEIERPLKEFPCTDPRVQSCLPKKIEGKFGLWEKEIPQVRRKSGIHPCQDCQEVVLEGTNGALRPITAMHVRGDELEFGVPLEGDGFFVRRACFVIQDLEINRETSCGQTGHDRIVGSNAMAITLSLEGLLKDEVAVCVKGDHHILVTRSSPNRKAAGVIGEKLTQWLSHDEDLVRSCGRGRRQNCQRSRRRLLGFCRSDVLALLGEMAHDGFVCVRTILGSIGVGKALEGVTIASFDGIQPGLFDWKAKTGMIKSNQGTNAG
jgi:hypothetical protein